jgi:hypothetical protein
LLASLKAGVKWVSEIFVDEVIGLVCGRGEVDEA